ncbi:MAG: hypothetical protein WBX15_07615 [Thermoanaerobaculia bacterium]
MIFQVISLLGAFLILFAFVANQTGRIERETVTYQLFNLLGGIALCITAVAERQYGFIVLEGVWSFVSLWALMKLTRP